MIPPKQLNGEEMVKKCGAKQQATPTPPNYQRSSNIENTWIDSNFRILMWNVHSLEGPRANNIHGGMALQTMEAGWKGSPQYIRSSHLLPVRVGSHRNHPDMPNAVSCWRTAREEKELATETMRKDLLLIYEASLALRIVYTNFVLSIKSPSKMKWNCTDFVRWNRYKIDFTPHAWYWKQSIVVFVGSGLWD